MTAPSPRRWMLSADLRELASLERLRVIAAVAPRVRSLTEAQRAKKLRRESGAETTVGEVVDAQLARANIELDVLPLDGTTRRTLCTECGVIFVPHSKAKRTLCGQCLQPVCPCGSGALAGPTTAWCAVALRALPMSAG